MNTAPFSLKNYKAIFFDWDGTLVDTLSYIEECRNRVLTEFGKKDGLSLGPVQKSARELFQSVFGDEAEEALNFYQTCYQENHLKKLKPITYTENMLTLLQKQKIKMGVVSNKGHKNLAIEVEHLRWGRFFDVVLGAGEAMRDKPEADPLNLAMTRIDRSLEPEHCLYVGDSETDLLCARNANMQAILIKFDQKNNDYDKLKTQYSPAQSLDAVHELQKLI